MIIPVKDKATQVHMAVVVAKPTDRAIMTLRMGGTYRALLHHSVEDKGGRRRGRGNHSSSKGARNMCPGGSTDRLL